MTGRSRTTKRGVGRVSFFFGLIGALAALPAAAAGLPGRDSILVTPRSEGLVGDADAASEGTLEEGQLDNRPFARPAEVLEAIPGVIVTQHSGTGKANQYFLRGFNLDHGTDFAVHVDGMPVNLPSHGHGQGYADLNFVIPELIDHVHYRKGPYFADEGDFSSAGAAHLHYRDTLERGIAQLSAGRFGYRRALVAGSTAAGGGALLGAVESVADDGPWRLPQDLRKLNAVLRHSSGTSASGATLTAMAYQGRWMATDQIPQRAIDAGSLSRFDAVDPSDGGKASRYSVSAAWTTSDENSSLRAQGYLVRSRLELFSNFTYFLADPVNGDQFRQIDRRTIAGGEISRRWKTIHEGRAMEHAAGLQLRQDRIAGVGLQLTAARAHLATVREDAVRQTSASAFYVNTWRWTEWLRSVLGLRADQFHFRVASDTTANSGTAHASQLSPKATLVFGPSHETEMFLNYGRGFHSNDARGATLRVNPDPRDPGFGAPAERVTPLVRSYGRELGLRTAPGRGLRFSAALWRLEVASELLFLGDAGTTEASRPSRRSGIELGAYWRPLPHVTADVDANWSRARFRDADPSGDRIPGAIGRTVSAGLAVGGARGWSGGVRLRHFGPRPLVEDNSVRSSSVTLVNARLSYGLGERGRLTVEILNLFNRRANDIEYWYESRLRGEPAPAFDRHLHPAEPRALRLSAALYF